MALHDNSKKKLFIKEIIEAETIDELKTNLNMLLIFPMECLLYFLHSIFLDLQQIFRKF